MNDKTRTHYRKAFDSPYLSSADIVEPTVLTIKHVKLEKDRTKKTPDLFNTAHFVEKELRPGEALKPMILNASNSKTLKGLTNSAFIEDWSDLRVTIYVDHNVRFGKDTVEGLRINPQVPTRRSITPDMAQMWANAKAAFKRDGDLRAVLARADMTAAHQQQLMAECDPEPATEVEDAVL